MQIPLIVGVLVIAYLLGAIPFGWIVVKIFSGRDIRKVASGRTGGTNAMRAAGFWAGLATAGLDVIKGALAVWIARSLVPGSQWLQVFAPIFAILGHNYSIFLAERGPKGFIRLRGGAGGAPCFGGIFGLWPTSILIILPLVAGIWYGIGYASVTTMSIALLSILIFAYRALIGASPWINVVYGVVAEILLIWALRPNIQRLINGTERLIGWRARRRKQQTNGG